MKDQRIAQIIDANLDRAREGLRVIEDWCRYGLGRKDYMISLKGWRQELGALHKKSYKNARSTIKDPGIGLTHPAQSNRLLPIQVVEANCARVQEALRVLEEFSRNNDYQLHKVSSKMRYEVYQLEVEVLEKTKASALKEKLRFCNL